MAVWSPSPANLERAAAILRQGGVVAFPTETVYGLGAAAFDERAVARVFEIKGRPRFDPLIVHAAAREEVLQLVRAFPPPAQVLADRFWPGPLTLVLPKSPRVPDIVTAGLDTVAVRVPNHPVALELLRRAGVPVAAPSANPFGMTSPTTAEHVERLLGSAVDFVLDGGPCPVGIESTVVLVAPEGEAMLLRPGGVPLEEIEALIGPLRQQTSAGQQPLAPGQLLRHYAPRTPIELCQRVPPPVPGARLGLLAFTPRDVLPGYAAVEVLSERGDLREAAARLFAALHRLDALGLERIFAQRVPAAGLGLAINDRLERAARKAEAPLA
jgi:L-threonylcarbamoyladenylate synthase